MLTQAILIGLVAMCVTFEWALGTCLASRPIVTGVLIGLVMGDLQTGIIVGATLEMVFIGSVTIGAAVPPRYHRWYFGHCLCNFDGSRR